MRVLLADHLKQERIALRRLLEQDPELSVVGVASEANSLLAKTKETWPDLILLNCELPGLPASELLHRLRCPGRLVKVVVFCGNAGMDEAAFSAGAAAFVRKREPVQELLNTVRTVGVLSTCSV